MGNGYATNLLIETLGVLKEHVPGREVLWVGSRDGEYSVTWQAFTLMAASINYDGGYGGYEMPLDLVVVGEGWWLERSEYDGSESWDFRRLPVSGGAPFTMTQGFPYEFVPVPQ